MHQSALDAPSGSYTLLSSQWFGAVGRPPCMQTRQHVPPVVWSAESANVPLEAHLHHGLRGFRLPLDVCDPAEQLADALLGLDQVLPAQKRPTLCCCGCPGPSGRLECALILSTLEATGAGTCACALLPRRPQLPVRAPSPALLLTAASPQTTRSLRSIGAILAPRAAAICALLPHRIQYLCIHPPDLRAQRRDQRVQPHQRRLCSA